MLSSFLVPALLASAAAAAPLEEHRRQTSCATGVHIIAARGSTEPQGEGPLQNVAAMIEASIAGSDDIAVVYPADLIPYDSSEETGVTNMTAEITTYVSACPDSRIVLLGYSQGGQIVGDVLGGGSYSNTPPIDYATYSKNIVAAVQFGDPAFVIGKSYDMGNATKSGVFARSDTTALDQWSDVLASYCMDHDIFCASGDSISTHTSEVQTFQGDAATFVINLVNG